MSNEFAVREKAAPAGVAQSTFIESPSAHPLRVVLYRATRKASACKRTGNRSMSPPPRAMSPD